MQLGRDIAWRLLHPVCVRDVRFRDGEDVDQDDGRLLRLDLLKDRDGRVERLELKQMSSPSEKVSWAYQSALRKAAERIALLLRRAARNLTPTPELTAPAAASACMSPAG